MPAPTHVAVLGGGLSGLSSAFHLSRRFPSATITLLEKSPRLGGWVHSERVHVRDNAGHEARILLERGPRTLRPNGKAILELVNLLNLSSSLLTVPKTSSAAKTRFLHIPGTNGLTALPSSPLSLFTSPLGRSLAMAAAKEPFRLYARPMNATEADESLEAFLAARLNPELARILGSALVHGIYAGDSRVLSVRAAFAPLWAIAQEGGGSVGRGLAWHVLRHMLGLAPKAAEKHYEIGDVAWAMQGVSVYSFREGMSTLVRALEEDLSRRRNVRIEKGEGVEAIVRSSGGDTEVTTSAGKKIAVSHIVSALQLTALQELLKRSALPLLPNLTANPMSSVSVVNLVFPPSPTGEPIHPEGFGYLIPRDKNGNATVLGTVFDSCSLGGQDEYATPDAPKFTKMTMMLRPSPGVAVMQDSVLAHLNSHLAPRTRIPEPVLFRVHHLHGCIPVPSVGHVHRMKELEDALRKVWGHRLTVIGAGVGGVSVGDCIEQGRHVGSSW